MTCEFVTDLIPIYADDASSDLTKSIVEKHIKECPSCRKFLESCRRDKKKHCRVKGKINKLRGKFSDFGEETISSADTEFARLSSRLKKRKKRHNLIAVGILSAMVGYIIFDVVRAVKKPGKSGGKK